MPRNTISTTLPPRALFIPVPIACAQKHDYVTNPPQRHKSCAACLIQRAPEAEAKRGARGSASTVVHQPDSDDEGGAHVQRPWGGNWYFAVR